ncbi:hypothetical protein Sthe_2020 [Sphaerobacter thermophilus DSM 20745]|uniref:Uncharacterized protein n=1 Tax=Sphaerobacter thermophilus (strain ATCC 49802 / DSM 20745 / KCCM 41009 / NCIMB 13125 / S 6022) TaxID=479434 RepID=D1C5P8_SPHTD|nr:hypothetical protein Sthe_2020 [Sphaerobacter thermophilus DSM 20745]
MDGRVLRGTRFLSNSRNWVPRARLHGTFVRLGRVDKRANRCYRLSGLFVGWGAYGCPRDDPFDRTVACGAGNDEVPTGCPWTRPCGPCPLGVADGPGAWLRHVAATLPGKRRWDMGRTGLSPGVAAPSSSSRDPPGSPSPVHRALRTRRLCGPAGQCWGVAERTRSRTATARWGTKLPSRWLVRSLVAGAGAAPAPQLRCHTTPQNGEEGGRVRLLRSRQRPPRPG